MIQREWWGFLSLFVNHSKKKPKFSITEHVSDFHIHSSAKWLENSFAILRFFYGIFTMCSSQRKKKNNMPQNCLILCQFQEDIHLYHCEQETKIITLVPIPRLPHYYVVIQKLIFNVCSYLTKDRWGPCNVKKKLHMCPLSLWGGKLEVLMRSEKKNETRNFVFKRQYLQIFMKQKLLNFENICEQIIPSSTYVILSIFRR